jgi:hypothetical protein
MKILTQLRFYVVVATLSFTGLLVNYCNQLEELRKTKEELVKCQTDKGYIPGGDITSAKEMDSVLYINDSLRDELFNERVDAGRHEVSREEVLNKYPKVKKEYESFYNHQTE